MAKHWCTYNLEFNKYISITIPLRQEDPPAEDCNGLIGSTADSVAVLEESLHSLTLADDSAEKPSPTSPDWLRPLHQSVTGNGPSKVPKADLKAALMSDWIKLIADDAWTWNSGYFSIRFVVFKITTYYTWYAFFL